MLVIRMQRSGRKGHAMFRVVVQDSRRTPTSGKLVAQLGSFDPHAKVIIIDKEKTQFYLDNGAQPSDRVARLLGTEGIKLPKWVVTPDAKKRPVRNVEKRRSTRPDEPEVEAPATSPTPEVAPETKIVETPESPDNAQATETPAAEETPTEEVEAPAKEEASVEEAEPPAAEPEKKSEKPK